MSAPGLVWDDQPISEAPDISSIDKIFLRSLTFPFQSIIRELWTVEPPVQVSCNQILLKCQINHPQLLFIKSVMNLLIIRSISGLNILSIDGSANKNILVFLTVTNRFEFWK